MSAKSSPPPNGPPCTEGGRLMAERAVGTDRGDRGVLRGRGRGKVTSVRSFDSSQVKLELAQVDSRKI